jgi:hypothetical protein
LISRAIYRFALAIRARNDKSRAAKRGKGTAAVTHRLTPYLLLAGLGLLFFADLAVHPTQTLYSDHSDLITYYLPVKTFLVRSWRQEGELPLWNPYSFAGSPFLHDIQVAAFYPPQLILYLLPQEWLGAAMSWLIVFHVILAGCGTYAYARSQGLGVPAALVAGLGYMFAGKWLLHLLGGGHHTFAPLAWLPLVLLGLEAALRRAGRGPFAAAVPWATAAGLVFGVSLLGSQPQLPFYAGLFVCLWVLGPALEQAGYLGGGGKRSWRRTGRALGHWLALGAWAALCAAGLAAVQLLPTLEAARETTRAVSGAPAGSAFVSVVTAVVSVVGPPLTGPGWEHQGGLGVVWAMAAALAPVLGRPRARFQAAVCLLLVLFALGGGHALEGLPGFRLFRIPTRMFLIAALPIALLAGTTTQALLTAPPGTALRRRCRRLMLGVLGAAGLCVAGQALLAGLRGIPLRFHPYWPALLLTVPAALWLVGRRTEPPGRWALAWTAVLLADLWALAWPLVDVREQADLYRPADCVAYVAGHAGERRRVLDRDLPAERGSTPLGFALPLVLQIEPVRGYNSLDVRRFKEYAQFINDRDGPVAPLEGLLNFPIRNRPLLDLLGAGYLLQPSPPPPEGTGWHLVETDARPRAFCVIAGGVRQLPPYAVYENADAFPRAFVVPGAAPLPDRPDVLAALKATDFRRTVLLEGAPPAAGAPPDGGAPGRATITDYRPNRVTVEAEAGAPSYLVLADIWYPGWVAAVDGRPVPLYRANFLFRAVRLPEGRHEVTFTFEPRSYRWGRLVSAVTLLLAAVVAGAAAVVARRARRKIGPPDKPLAA